MLSALEIVLVAWLSSRTGSTRFLTDPLTLTEAAELVCRVSSAADEERHVRVEALDAAGVATFDSGPFPLAAGASYLSSGGVDARRCRFTVDGEIVGVRAHGLVVSGGGVVSLPPRRVP